MNKFKIDIPDSIGVACKIFRLFDQQLTQRTADETIFALFSNCREQGISLVNYITGKQVLFSLDRHGGDIVVYYGFSDEYDDSSNLPKTEKVWERAKYFGLDDYEGVVSFLREWLLSRDKRGEKKQVIVEEKYQI